MKIIKRFKRWLRGDGGNPDMMDFVSPCRCGPNDLCPCDVYCEAYDAHKDAKLADRAAAESARGPYR
jgi:hypothetical protein